MYDSGFCSTVYIANILAGHPIIGTVNLISSKPTNARPHDVYSAKYIELSTFIAQNSNSET